MKKLLYTLILGLTFVACDKDNNSDLITAATPAELEISNQVMNVDLEKRFEAFNTLIAGVKIDNKNASESANKGGDNGANWLELQWFTSGDEGYVYLRPDTLGSGCDPDGVTNHFKETYTLVSATELNIQVADGIGQTFGLPASLQTRYGQVFNATTSSIFFADVNADDSSDWNVRFGAIPTATIID